MQSDDRVIFMSRHYYIPQDDDDNGEYQDKFDSILEGQNNEETGEVLNAVNQQELAAKYGVQVRQE